MYMCELARMINVPVCALTWSKDGVDEDVPFLLLPRLPPNALNVGDQRLIRAAPEACMGDAAGGHHPAACNLRGALQLQG